jgi:hypothetical protein
MFKTFKKWVSIFLVVIFVVIVAILGYHKNKIYVWAWERPEDLRFLSNIKNSNNVVYYAGGIVIKNGQLDIQPRINSLLIAQGARLTPVVRIDNFDKSSVFTDQLLQKIENFIVTVCQRPDIVGCQVDFDARTSEYISYTKLLNSIKKRLPENVPLSITALVSWCDKFSWLNDTSINFAVPMFYRLGPDKERIQNDNVGSTFMKSPKCQSAVGLSTDEVFPNRKYIKGKDIYLFNPQSWTKENFVNKF